MNLNCLTDIYRESLLFDFDITNTSSWQGNNDLTITSTTVSCETRIKDDTLFDFGLTGYDVANSNLLTSISYIDNNNDKFELHRINYKNNTGATFTYGDIGQSTDIGIGQYFSLSGGYLQNFFKLYGYDYELFPYRYNNGFTLETWLKIDSTSFNSSLSNKDGIFLFLGSRAENKFVSYFSGNTDHKTSIGNGLYDNNITDIETDDYNNALAFKLNKDKTFSYVYIDGEGNKRECKTNKTVDVTGWTSFSITFTPYEIITNFETSIDCYKQRDGDLKVYLNGNLFWKESNVKEFWFKNLNTTREKQIGVPYNISWGGGTFGLKHSYNFDDRFMIDNTNLLSGYITSSSYSLSSDTITTTIYNDNTGVTFTDSVLLSFDNQITLLPNKQYEFSLNVDSKTLFITTPINPSIQWGLSGLTTSVTGITTLTEITYYNNPTPNSLVNIKLKIQTPTNWDITGVTINPFLYTSTDITQINQLFETTISDVELYQYNFITDNYSINPLNNNLLLEDIFDGSFHGGIQKFRMYGTSLTSTIIKHNFSIDNYRYVIPSRKGGRLIYY